jgi:hypothetical protein
MENRRQFMDELKLKFNIQHPSDWGKLSKMEIKKVGGAMLLSYYQESLFLCLKSIYRGISENIEVLNARY